MAWVSNGSGISIINYNYGSTPPTSKYTIKENRTWSVQTSTDNCLYCLKKDNSPLTTYELYCVTRGTGDYAEGTRNMIKTIYYNDDTSTTSTIEGTFHSVGAFSTGVNTTGDLIYSGSTTIPCFNKQSDADNYVKSGDTSNQILFLNTKWNLYIDGSQNPLYKLTWDCHDVPTSDTSKVKVLFCSCK